MTTNLIAGVDLTSVLAPRILAADLDLLDHCLVLCHFSHDNMLNQKVFELQLRQQGNLEVAEIGFMRNEQLEIAMACYAKMPNFQGCKFNSTIDYIIS